jgi:protein-disulfide isomerase
MKSRLLVSIAVASALALGVGSLAAGWRSAEAEEPAATPVTPMVAPDTSDLSDAQRSEVEAIIKNYLIANPEIIRDALNELQRRQDEAEQIAQAKAIGDNTALLFSSQRQVVLGNPKGDVTLVEFFDYNCTYCKRAHADMKKLIENDKNLRVVLKEFPVLGEGSVAAAQVATAVNIVAPDRYGEFHDKLLSERGQANAERALAIVDEMGLDRKAIEAKVNSDEVKASITEAYDLANKLSLSGTPSYVTAKEVVVGAVGYDALKKKIEAARCTVANC